VRRARLVNQVDSSDDVIQSLSSHTQKRNLNPTSIIIRHRKTGKSSLLFTFCQPNTMVVFTAQSLFILCSSLAIACGFTSSPVSAAPQSATKTSLFMAVVDAVPSRQFIFQGMELFRQGDVQGSIAKFDASVPEGASAYLWQRGLSYYYNDEFEKGSKQFRDDVLRSPLDVEEIVWDIACLLRMDPDTFPPKNMMSLPPGKTDRRPIMVSKLSDKRSKAMQTIQNASTYRNCSLFQATVYSLFQGNATEHDLAKSGHSGGPADEFYSLLYLGLFNEAQGEISKAENYMKSAINTKYAKAVGSKDYMVDVARVHCSLRHWTTS
jgi:hypothetical protein